MSAADQARNLQQLNRVGIKEVYGVGNDGADTTKPAGQRRPAIRSITTMPLGRRLNQSWWRVVTDVLGWSCRNLGTTIRQASTINSRISCSSIATIQQSTQL